MKNEIQTIKANARFVRMSPRKLRLVANAVNQLPINFAIANLKALNKRAAAIILKVLQQAVGNAKNNLKLSPDDLKIGSLLIEEGPRSKRSDRHAHGARFGGGVRHKRSAHVTVKLSQKNG